MASRFWVGGTGTWDASDTTHWASSTGGAGGASVPGASDTVTFDGSSGGGTVTVNTDPNIQSLDMGSFTGTLDFATNNNNISMSTFSSSGTATRTLNMGNGTWTITGTVGTVWNVSTATNFTFNCNSSTLVFSATAVGNRVFSTGVGARTFNNITVSNPSPNAYLFDLNSTGGLTVNGNLTLTDVQQVRLPGSATTTVTGTFSFNGSAGAPVLLYVNSGAAGTLSVANAAALSWAAIQNVTKSGAGSITVNNGFDLGGNTSITIAPPIPGVIGG